MKISKYNFRDYLIGLSGNPQVSSYYREREMLSNIIQSSNSPSFIMDHSTFDYVYVNNSLSIITGLSAYNWKKDGVNLFYELFPNTHLDAIYKRFNDTFKFYFSLPSTEKNSYIFASNFLAKKTNGNKVWILCQNIFVQPDEKGNPLYSIAYLSDITSYLQNRDLELKIGRFENGKYVVKYQKRYLLDEREIKLSIREAEILRMMADGLTSKQIADQLFISQFTVNTHRQNMLLKSGSNTPAELVYKAKDQGVI